MRCVFSISVKTEAASSRMGSRIQDEGTIKKNTTKESREVSSKETNVSGELRGIVCSSSESTGGIIGLFQKILFK